MSLGRPLFGPVAQRLTWKPSVTLAAYWLDDDGDPIISVDDEVRERIDEEAPELIPDAVVAIYRYWRAQSLRTKPVATLH